jgi:molybdate transport system substrate-binding protein
MRMLLLGLLLWSPVAFADTIRVAVASNFLGPVQAIARAFEQDSGHRVRISSGSTGKFYAQVVNGAPYDLFLAANDREPERLEREGRIAAGSRYTYALGVLALWAPSALEETPADALAAFIEASGQRVAIANPKTAPYGAAAEAVLKAWGQWDGLQGRVIRGENIAQAYQFAASGNAGFGFVALSQMLDPDRQPAGRYWRVDDRLYPPIRQQLVLLKRAADKPAATAFWQYLKSSAAQQQMVAFGYGLE